MTAVLEDIEFEAFSAESRRGRGRCEGRERERKRERGREGEGAGSGRSGVREQESVREDEEQRENMSSPIERGHIFVHSLLVSFSFI